MIEKKKDPIKFGEKLKFFFFLNKIPISLKKNKPIEVHLSLLQQLNYFGCRI